MQVQACDARQLASGLKTGRGVVIANGEKALILENVRDEQDMHREVTDRVIAKIAKSHTNPPIPEIVRVPALGIT